MTAACDAPYPFLLGLDERCLASHDLSPDVIRVSLDQDQVTIHEPYPRLQSAFYKPLLASLKAVVKVGPHTHDQVLATVDQAFNMLLIDPEELPDFKHLLVRDVLLDFMVKRLKGYDKYMVGRMV